MPRGIPNRAEAVQSERRRRRDDTLNRVHHLKLAIPAEFRDDKEHEYRWINDENSRVYDLTKEDDWDICTTSKPETSDDDRVRRPVGTKDGKPLYAYLVRKPKAFYDEDKRRNAARVAGAEQELLTRPPTDNSQAAATNYVTPGSTIKRGAYAP